LPCLRSRCAEIRKSLSERRVKCDFSLTRISPGVMDGTEWNGEFIAHFQAEPSGLRIAHMVRVRGRAPQIRQG